MVKPFDSPDNKTSYGNYSRSRKVCSLKEQNRVILSASPWGRLSVYAKVRLLILFIGAIVEHSSSQNIGRGSTLYEDLAYGSTTQLLLS